MTDWKRVAGKVLPGAFLFFLAAAVPAQESRFVPPEGKTLLLIGQNSESIVDYIVVSGRVPAGLMIYTSIQECGGLYETSSFGAGTIHGEYLVERYPNAVIQIGLYMVGVLEQIVEGQYDANIDRIGRWIAGARCPVYLRIGYEFDFPENRYEPEAYVAAYRYIVDRLRDNGVENIAYVWHSFAGHTQRSHGEYYPGDEYVDWFGISYFDNQSSIAMGKMAALAEERGKPLMIAEATPAKIGVDGGMQSYYRWYRPLFQFIEKNDVRMLCYINMDWDSLPFFAHLEWRNARVQANSEIRRLWFEEMDKDRYLHSSIDLFETLGYVPDAE